MTYDELEQHALSVVAERAIGWAMAGGDLVAYYTHDDGELVGMPRGAAIVALRASYPGEPAVSKVERALRADTNARWVIATSGAIFVWFKVEGHALRAPEGPPS